MSSAGARSIQPLRARGKVAPMATTRRSAGIAADSAPSACGSAVASPVTSRFRREAIALPNKVTASFEPPGIRSTIACSIRTDLRIEATTPAGAAGGKAAVTRVPSGRRTSTTGLSGAGGGKAVLQRRQSASATAFGSPRLVGCGTRPDPRSTKTVSEAVSRTWLTAGSANSASKSGAPPASVPAATGALPAPKEGTAAAGTGGGAAPGRPAAATRRPALSMSSSPFRECAKRPTLPVSSSLPPISPGAADEPNPSSKLSVSARLASGGGGRRGGGGGGGGTGIRPERGGRAASSSSSPSPKVSSSLTLSPAGRRDALDPARGGGGGGGGIGRRGAPLPPEGASTSPAAGATPPPKSTPIRKSPT